MVVTYPSSVLLKACEFWKSSVIDPYRHQRLVNDMRAVCAFYNGQGLAANQIGVLKRVILYQDNQGELQSLTNPEILEFGSEKATTAEGCLSLPGLQVQIARPTEITVTGLNEQLLQVTMIAEGREARAIQHEIDHLDGKLITDHQGSLNRKMLLDKWMKKTNKFRRISRQKLAA